MTTTHTCDHCGAAIPSGEGFYCGDDLLCLDCASEHTICRDECGTRIYRDDDNGDENCVLCWDCFDRYYFRCDGCGVIVRNEFAYRPAWSDQTLCEDCYNDLDHSSAIHEYSYAPDELVFHGDGPRYLGVELEIDCGGTRETNAEKLLQIANSADENLYIKTDGSLDEGLELVTHPMSLDYHLNEMPWPEVLDKAKQLGYLSHRASTCGLHVHVSRLAFGETYDEQEAAIARLVFFVEKFWPELLRFSRRTRRQLDRWAARYGAKLNPKDQLAHAKSACAGRYMAVNLQNSETVELRLFRGTLKLNTLLATLQMVDHLCEVAVSMSDAELQDMGWHDFLQEIHEPELIQYLKERNLYVNDPVLAEEDE